MPTIVLVYPEFTVPTFWSFRESLKILEKRANMPPYGLITVAAMLPSNCHVTLHDENIQPASDADLMKADLVMASAMIVQRDSLVRLIRRCNSLGRPIMVGGPLINTGFEQIPDADHYYIGEAENGLSNFIADFLSGKAKKVYGHVVDPEKGERIRRHFNGDATLIVGNRPPLSATPLPRFDLLDHASYHCMSVQFSRGCPVGCDFCDIWTQYGKKPRTKPVDRLLAELNAIRDIGFAGSLFIVDDNFIGNKKVVKSELLPALIQWQEQNKYPFQLFTEATITLADDDELLALMSQAGFDMVFCGIETPDEKSLIDSNKTLNTDYRGHETVAKLLRQIERVQRAGIEVCTGLIIGFDSEPANIDAVMSEFIQRANIPIAMAGLLTALPETDLEKRLLREGRLRKKSDGNNTHTFELNFEPRRPEAEIVDAYKRLLNELYDETLERYFFRCGGYLDRIPSSARSSTKLSVSGTYTLLRSFLQMSLKPYGWNYFKFLLKRLLKSPRTFGQAVALGIKGHHLAHITRCTIQQHDESEIRSKRRTQSERHAGREAIECPRGA